MPVCDGIALILSDDQESFRHCPWLAATRDKVWRTRDHRRFTSAICKAVVPAPPTSAETQPIPGWNRSEIIGASR